METCAHGRLQWEEEWLFPGKEVLFETHTEAQGGDQGEDGSVSKVMHGMYSLVDDVVRLGSFTTHSEPYGRCRPSGGRGLWSFQ